MPSKQKTNTIWLTALLAVSAGVIYNSWPLGFWLNPRVSNNGGLASELEGLHQPYSWLFIALDIVTGLFVVAVMVLLWNKRMRFLGRLALVTFGLFGVFTIVDALLPMPCQPSVAICPGLLDQPMLIAHGAANVGSALALFISAALVWHLRRTHDAALVMRGLLAVWAMFWLLSIYFFLIPGPANFSQDYYLLICGIWIALMPWLIRGDVLYVRRARQTPSRVRVRY